LEREIIIQFWKNRTYRKEDYRMYGILWVVNVEGGRGDRGTGPVGQNYFLRFIMTLS
jgi:hypothetical protein